MQLAREEVGGRSKVGNGLRCASLPLTVGWGYTIHADPRFDIVQWIFAAKVAGLTVGAGISANEVGVNDSYAVGVSTQVGAFTVGGAYSHGAGHAREVGVSYALSARSSVQVAYQDLSTGNNTAQVRLQHLF